MTTTRRAGRPVKRDLSDLAGLRVALYGRVSLDEDNTGKSTGDQEAAGREWAERVRAEVVEAFIEQGSRSASRFATKEREEFARLLSYIEAGRLDAVWFWELSRSQRRLDVFAKLRDLCRDMGVLWVIRDRVYDLTNNGDLVTLGMLSVMGENESEMTAERVRRGKASSARSGRRAGRVPYGYRAVYDRAGRYLHDEPDRYDADGKPAEDSPAAVVAEIYDRIRAGHSITSIRRNLNDRGVRTRRGYEWANSTLLTIATNPTYLGQRTQHVRDLRPHERVKAVLEGVEAQWPPLVDAETWWAVHRILSDPARKTTRPARGVHLLSSLATCGECGGRLVRKKGRKGRATDEPVYFCADRSCVGIYAGALDEYAEKVLVRWLSSPDVMADLTRVDDSAAAAQARADVEQARAELAELYREAEAGRVSPGIATATERGLQGRIADAEQRIQAATLPPVLRGNIGEQAAAGWAALDMEVKRQIIRSVADIRVHKVGRCGKRRYPVSARVSWRWLIGAEAGRNEAEVAAAVEEHTAVHDARLTQRREKVAHLRELGWTRDQIAEECGVSVHTIKKDLAAAR